MSDPINPDYYNGDECMKAIATATEKLHGEEAVCTGFIIKYLWRWKQKGGMQDLEKAEWYLKRLKEAFEEAKPEYKSYLDEDMVKRPIPEHSYLQALKTHVVKESQRD